MAIVRTDIAESLKYGVKAGFLEAQGQYKSQRGLISRETPSTGKDEDYVGLGEHPMPREFVDQIVPKAVNERNITITNKDWEVSIAVEDNAVNDDRVGYVLDWARRAGEAYERHMEKLAFQALNAGDATTYGLCYDGLDLFSATHKDKGAEYTTVQSNLNALTLSWTNFNTAYVAMLNYLDARGEPVGMVPDLLVVPAALKAMAAQIAENREKESTANRDINPFAGEIKYVVSPYFDSTAWVLVASAFQDKPVLFQMRQAPELEIIRKGEEKRSIYSWVARYNVGYSNWRLTTMGNT